MTFLKVNRDGLIPFAPKTAPKSRNPSDVLTVGTIKKKKKQKRVTCIFSFALAAKEEVGGGLGFHSTSAIGWSFEFCK